MNEKVRISARENGVYLWQIADALGIRDDSFSKKLRHPLTPEEEKKALEAIDRISREART